MRKIERVILRLGNDSTTQRKLHAINKFMLISDSSWHWAKSAYYAGGSRKSLTSSEVSALTESLSKDPTEELYVVFSVEDKAVGITVMNPEEEDVDNSSNYWITCVEHLSFEFTGHATVGEAFSKISERMSEYTISFDVAKDAMLSFSADTSAMKDCIEKLKKELTDERHKNSFGF